MSEHTRIDHLCCNGRTNKGESCPVQAPFGEHVKAAVLTLLAGESAILENNEQRVVQIPTTDWQATSYPQPRDPTVIETGYYCRDCAVPLFVDPIALNSDE